MNPKKKEKMISGVKQGDCVLATKYANGSPEDFWEIGYYEAEVFPGRHKIMPINNHGNYAGMFRRVELIPFSVGNKLKEMSDTIKESGKDLWWWKNHLMHKEKNAQK